MIDYPSFRKIFNEKRKFIMDLIPNKPDEPEITKSIYEIAKDNIMKILTTKFVTIGDEQGFENIKNNRKIISNFIDETYMCIKLPETNFDTK